MRPKKKEKKSKVRSSKKDPDLQVLFGVDMPIGLDPGINFGEPPHHTVTEKEARALAVRSMGRRRLRRVLPSEVIYGVEVFDTSAGPVVHACLFSRQPRICVMDGKVIGEFDAYVSVMVFVRDVDRVARCLEPRDPSFTDPDDKIPDPRSLVSYKARATFADIPKLLAARAKRPRRRERAREGARGREKGRDESALKTATAKKAKKA